MTTTENENETRHNLTLGADHYKINGGELREYDIRITSSPFKVAAIDAYGMFCIISFIGRWNVEEDKDWVRSISREINHRFPNSTKEEMNEHYANLGKEINWFHGFSNGNWDAAEKIIQEDAEIRHRFNTFATRWWKVVCDLVLTKIYNRTYDAWIAEKRESVGAFLENGVEKEKINEQYYNASYKNYAKSYEMIKTVADYQQKIVSCWGEEVIRRKELGHLDPTQKDWSINLFSSIDKSIIIYDKENCFHLISKTNLNTIVVAKLTETLHPTPLHPTN